MHVLIIKANIGKPIFCKMLVAILPTLYYVLCVIVDILSMHLIKQYSILYILHRYCDQL